MFQFSQHTLEIGGRVLIPDSMISKVDYAFIESKNHLGIFVVYFKNTGKEQRAFYRYAWLQQKYGPKVSHTVPKYKAVSSDYVTLCKSCQKFKKYCQCNEVPDDELPTSLQ